MTHRGRCWPDLILASSALSLILFTSIYNGQCPLCMHASTKQLPIDIGQLISNYFDLHLYEFPDLTALSQAYPRWLLTECADQKLSINIPQHIFCTTPLHGKRNLRTKTSWDFFLMTLKSFFQILSCRRKCHRLAAKLLTLTVMFWLFYDPDHHVNPESANNCEIMNP